MLKELYTASLGMLNQQTKLEVVSNNLANANTTGYKKAEAFERNLIDARANFYNTPGDIEQNDSPVGSYYDLTAGSMQQTDNPLDLAIEGSGFFVLQDEEGKDFLTRNGSFSINKEGFIVARDGKKLQGENGSVRIDQEFFAESRSTGESKALDVKVAETGEIFVNDYEVGKLMLADAENPQSLQRISASNFVFTFDSEPKYLQGSEVRLRQGWLEGSNVNIVDEMIRMIDLQRQFEAGSKVIQTNDGTLQNSIQLGRYY